MLELIFTSLIKMRYVTTVPQVNVLVSQPLKEGWRQGIWIHYSPCFIVVSPMWFIRFIGTFIMIINLFCQKIEKNTDREKKKELTAWKGKRPPNCKKNTIYKKKKSKRK